MAVAVALALLVIAGQALLLRFVVKEGMAERNKLHERIDGLVALNAEERRHSDDAVQVLLDRIQHPEVRQVLPSEPIEPLHTDDAEMAHIGDVVPDFVAVGSHEQIRAEEPGTVNE